MYRIRKKFESKIKGQPWNPEEVKSVVRDLVRMADESWPDHMEGWSDWAIELYIELLEAIRDGQINETRECIVIALQLADYNGPGTVEV